MLDSRVHSFVVTRLALCRENDGSTLSRLRGSHDVLTVPNDVRQIQVGNVEKSRQRRSRPFAVLTYRMYAPRVKKAAALLDLPPPKRLRAGRRTFLNIPSN